MGCFEDLMEFREEVEKAKEERRDNRAQPAGMNLQIIITEMKKSHLAQRQGLLDSLDQKPK